VRFLILILLCGLARADYAETEQRLKAAGVDAALRKRVHSAIDRAAMFLVSTQKKDGSWKPSGVTWRHPAEAETVYAALALRHAGTPPTRAPVRHALAWLIPEGSRGRRGIARHVYTAGPMAMLLQANGSHEKFAVAYGDAIAGAQRQHGWWDYATSVKSSGGGIRKQTLFDAKVENLSTSQFGALGLWAADRVRGAPSRPIWRKHLASMVKLQMRSGSWRYAPKPPYDAGGYGYYTGTFMGVANLLLAEAGTRGARRDKKLAAKLPEAKRRAMFALERDAPAFLQLFEASATGHAYYGLYALEKAAIFSDREVLGGVRWYVEGATMLCDRQDKDGSWTRRNLIDTSFALLFLLRASKSYHPTTPRDVEQRRGPVSGGEPKPPPKEPAKPAPIPVAQATKQVAQLEKALHARRVAELPKPEDVLAIAETDVRIEGDAKQIAAWRKRWTKLLWRLLAAAPRGSLALRERWDALQVAGAQVLARTGRGVAKATRGVLERGPLKNKRWQPSAAWWNAVLSELYAATATPKSMQWLVDELAHADIRHLDRLAATLQSVRAVAPKLPLKARKALVKKLLIRFEGKETEYTRRPNGSRTELDWDSYGALVISTLRTLTRDPKTGAYPAAERAKPISGTEHYRDWARR